MRGVEVTLCRCNASFDLRTYDDRILLILISYTDESQKPEIHVAKSLLKHSRPIARRSALCSASSCFSVMGSCESCKVASMLWISSAWAYYYYSLEGRPAIKHCTGNVDLFNSFKIYLQGPICDNELEWILMHGVGSPRVLPGFTQGSVSSGFSILTYIIYMIQDFNITVTAPLQEFKQSPRSEALVILSFRPPG